MTAIKPTVGRVVWYWPQECDPGYKDFPDAPLAAPGRAAAGAAAAAEARGRGGARTGRGDEVPLRYYEELVDFFLGVVLQGDVPAESRRRLLDYAFLLEAEEMRNRVEFL